MFGKIFTTFAVIALVLNVAIAGNHVGPKAKAPLRNTGEEPIRMTGAIVPPVTYSGGPGDSIGFADYDYGTNGSSNRNLINYGDGTLSFGRMASAGSQATDRGSYYKYYDGTSWTTGWTRVEAVRRGWGNIDQIADAGGVEVILSHTGMEVNVDAAKGAGVWSSVIAGGTGQLWPRLAIGSGFTIHVQYSNGNPPTGLFYASSPDAGTTWNLDQTIYSSPGAIADADGYDIAAQGMKVAFVIGGAGGDIVLVESFDGGATWTESVVWDIDESLSTPQDVPDGSVSAYYDAAGNLHLAWGSYYTLGDGNLYLSQDSPIRHWSMATGTQMVAYANPDTNIGTPPGRDGNYITQPDLCGDAEGNVFMIYTKMIPELDDSNNNYEHVFGRALAAGGTTWAGEVDITDGTGFDAAFPSAAELVGSNLHLVYMCDPIAGNNIQGTHAPLQAAFMYLAYDKTILLNATGVKEIPDAVPQTYQLAQNYPNPFNPATNIRYSIPEKSMVTLKVYDVLGREVATLVNGVQEAGSYVADFNASNLANGTYLYTLTAGNFTQTNKMMLLK